MTIRTIYLAHPIDQTDGCPLADRTAQALKQAGYVCYRPGHAFNAQPPYPAELQQINNRVQTMCDATVVIIPAGVPTIGTLLELAQAQHNNQPTVVVTDIPAGHSAALEAIDLPTTRNPADTPRLLAATQPVNTARWEGNGQQPGYGKPGDAGFDLYIHTDQPIEIPAGGFVNIPSEIAVQLPHRLWGMIVGRSSSWKRQIYVAPAIIDAGYRGPLYACTWNVGTQPVTLHHGERVAQLIPMPLIAPDIQWTNQPLDPTERGTTGFGSTGR